MVSEEKRIMVSEFRTSLNEADSFIIIGYSGLSSNQLNELRGILRGAGCVLRVVKNCIAAIVMQEERLRQFNECVDGPTAFVLISGEPVALTKVLAGFAKEHAKLKLRGGMVQSIPVMENDIMSIAKLPNRELLLAQLVGSLVSPIAGFIGIIISPVGAFVRSLDKIREKLGGENHAKEKGNN